MVLLLLLSTVLLACLPLLILAEYVFEVNNSDVITLFRIQFHSPVYYLETLSDFTGNLYSTFGKYTALSINYVHSLNLPELCVRHVGLFWKCVKRITHLTFKTVMPIENFKRNFVSNLNPDVVHFSPKTLLRTKRQRRFDDEDLAQSAIFEKLQTPSTQTVDESTKKEIEQFVEETDDSKTNVPNSTTSEIDSSTNVFGMDKVYKMGEIDPLVDATDVHNTIVKGSKSKYTWDKPEDDIVKSPLNIHATVIDPLRVLSTIPIKYST